MSETESKPIPDTKNWKPDKATAAWAEEYRAQLEHDWTQNPPTDQEPDHNISELSLAQAERVLKKLYPDEY